MRGGTTYTLFSVQNDVNGQGKIRNRWQHQPSHVVQVRYGSLTEDEILDAPLSLIDSGGANAVSVRDIAAKVAVVPNAVYTYFFPDTAALVTGPVERSIR
ncbi:MAG TPA: helix-turn-helix domain-containing protein [Kineosporiaceae bacterium]|nr:helix-turn-helix domain-containing protein [Kineosporiaceae bacterium]